MNYRIEFVIDHTILDTLPYEMTPGELGNYIVREYGSNLVEWDWYTGNDIVIRLKYSVPLSSTSLIFIEGFHDRILEIIESLKKKKVRIIVNEEELTMLIKSLRHVRNCNYYNDVTRKQSGKLNDRLTNYLETFKE